MAHWRCGKNRRNPENSSREELVTTCFRSIFVPSAVRVPTRFCQGKQYDNSASAVGLQGMCLGRRRSSFRCDVALGGSLQPGLHRAGFGDLPGRGRRSHGVIRGGAILTLGGSPRIQDNFICRNTANSSGAGAYLSDAGMFLNNALLENTPDNLRVDAPALVITAYSHFSDDRQRACIEASWIGTSTNTSTNHMSRKAVSTQVSEELAHPSGVEPETF